METLKTLLKAFLNKKFVFSREEELETYEKFLNSGCDFFQKSKKILAPHSFFGLLYNARTEKSLEECDKILDLFMETIFFKKDYYDLDLADILKQLELFKNYEVCMLLDFIKISKSNLIEQIKSREQKEKIQRQLGEKINLLDYVNQKGIPFDDFYFVLQLYYDWIGYNKLDKKEKDSL